MLEDESQETETLKLRKENKMWGVCLDSNAIQDGLFQTVIQYKRKENGEVVIISPKTTYKLDIKHVKELSAPPQYIYGECVSPCNHPDMIGIVCDIAWHFKLNCYFYIIKVNGRPKSKRYYDGDLNPIV